MTEKFSWHEMEKITRWKIRKIKLKEFMDSWDWEAIGVFVFGLCALVTIVVLAFIIREHANHAEDVDGRTKIAKLEACKSAVNIDACLAIVNR